MTSADPTRHWVPEDIALAVSSGTSPRAVTPGHVGQFYYSMGPTPAYPGHRNITFPITVHEMAPVKRGWYFAMQFRFLNADGSRGNMGYIGVQPRPNASGTGFHAYCPFSLFGSGGEIVDGDRCRLGADGGAGITCNSKVAIEDFQFGREYLFTVEQDDDEPTWRGYITDAVTGWHKQLGAWKVPEGQKGIQNYHLGFSEWWLRLDSCGGLPYSRATYGRPYSSRPDWVGTFKPDPYEANKPCQGKSGFSWVRNTDGTITTQAGFKHRNRPEPEPCPCGKSCCCTVNVNLGLPAHVGPPISLP